MSQLTIVVNVNAFLKILNIKTSPAAAIQFLLLLYIVPGSVVDWSVSRFQIYFHFCDTLFLLEIQQERAIDALDAVSSL